MHQKGSIALLVIAIVIALAAAGGVGWYYYSSDDEADVAPVDLPEQEESSRGGGESQPDVTNTSNWQVYQNMQRGYAVKYPAEWYFYSTGYSPPPPTTVMFGNVPEAQMANAQATFEIFAVDAGGETLETYEEIQNSIASGSTQSTATVSGQNAVKLTTPDTLRTIVTYYVLNGSFIYRLGYGVSKNVDIASGLIDICEQIVDEFGFVN